MEDPYSLYFANSIKFYPNEYSDHQSYFACQRVYYVTQILQEAQFSIIKTMSLIFVLYFETTPSCALGLFLTLYSGVIHSWQTGFGGNPVGCYGFNLFCPYARQGSIFCTIFLPPLFVFLPNYFFLKCGCLLLCLWLK